METSTGLQVRATQFNLAEDLSEQNNLLKANKKQYPQQLEEVKAWEQGLIDPIFKPLQGRHTENERVKKRQSK